MRCKWLISVALTSALLAGPVQARKTDRPITDREPDAEDVATTPVSDLGLRKDEIPQLLLDAQTEPYNLDGLNRCRPLIDAVEELDSILGDDLDLPQSVRQGPSAGRVAQKVVGSFIPFRGIVREVSGANAHERRVQAAIQAGLARRGFLKGVGQSRGCRYPARPAGPREVEAHRAAIEAAKKKSEK